jgi:hypothetical protein
MQLHYLQLHTFPPEVGQSLLILYLFSKCPYSFCQAHVIIPVTGQVLRFICLIRLIKTAQLVLRLDMCHMKVPGLIISCSMCYLYEQAAQSKFAYGCPFPLSLMSLFPQSVIHSSMESRNLKVPHQNNKSPHMEPVLNPTSLITLTSLMSVTNSMEQMQDLRFPQQ